MRGVGQEAYKFGTAVIEGGRLSKRGMQGFRGIRDAQSGRVGNGGGARGEGAGVIGVATQALEHALLGGGWVESGGVQTDNVRGTARGDEVRTVEIGAGATPTGVQHVLIIANVEVVGPRAEVGRGVLLLAVTTARAVRADALEATAGVRGIHGGCRKGGESGRGEEGRGGGRELRGCQSKMRMWGGRDVVTEKGNFGDETDGAKNGSAFNTRRYDGVCSLHT